MNLLITIDNYYPIHGGIQQYVRTVAHELSGRGIEVHILTQSLEGQPQEESMPEGVVHRSDFLVDALKDPFSVVNNYREVAEIIEELDVDLVYSNNHNSLTVIKAAQRIGKPVIYGCHGWGLMCPKRKRFLKKNNEICDISFSKVSLKACRNCDWRLQRSLRFRNLIKNPLRAWKRLNEFKQTVRRYQEAIKVVHSADARVAISKEMARKFNPENTFKIHLPIDISSYRPLPSGPFLRKYDLEDRGYLVLVGRVHNTKGHEYAVESLKYLPEDIKLVIVGNATIGYSEKSNLGPYGAFLEKLVRNLELEDRVIFTGLRPHDEMVMAYSAALASLAPSIWLEPFGYVTIEAMACSTPPIVTKNCGSSELVNEKVGRVVPRMDPLAIAKAVKEILPHRTEMGIQARQQVCQSVNPKIIVDELLLLFHGIINA